MASDAHGTLFIAMFHRIASFLKSSSGRRSRWRLLLLLAAFSVGWKVLLLTLGAALPRWVIDEGVGHIPLSMQPYATQARATALALWNRPIERKTLVRSVRVVSVDSTRGAMSTSCDGKSARVRAYTFFAIPYSEVRTMCDSGVVEYRVFRRRQ